MFKRDNETDVDIFQQEISSQIANSSIEDQYIKDLLSDWDHCIKPDMKNEDEK